jgi:hypothetical protein
LSFRGGIELQRPDLLPHFCNVESGRPIETGERRCQSGAVVQLVITEVFINQRQEGNFYEQPGNP